MPYKQQKFTSHSSGGWKSPRKRCWQIWCLVKAMESLPGSSIHGIFQARILGWVAISFSRRCSQPREWTRVSQIVGRCFTIWTTREVFKLVLEKAEEPEIKLPTSSGSSKTQESSKKTSISALLTMPKPLTVWITINCRKFWKRWEYQTTRPATWETYMQDRKQQLELDMEQRTGSK